MATRRLTALTLIAMVVFAALVLPAGGRQVTAAPGRSIAEKKICKYVTKTVKGKKKRVKVCRNVSAPRPTATPTDVPYPAPPNPLSVSVETDATRAVSAAIPVTGGTLTARSADGSTFTLTIPGGALSEETNVTMTPISRIGGLPAKAVLGAGVDLRPEGLTFLKPAQLVMTLAHPVPPAQQISVGYREAGRELYLEPLDLDPNTISFTLFHFSGHALFTPKSDDAPAVQGLLISHTPTNAFDQFGQHMEPLIQGNRANQVSDQRVYDTAAALLRLFYEQTLLPTATTATGDSSALPDALQYYIMWENYIQKYGLDSRFTKEEKEVLNLLRTAVRHAIEEAGTHCGEGAQFLYQDKSVGWLTDPISARKVLAYSQAAAFLLPEEAATLLDTALKNCRAHGFMFENLTWDVQAGPAHLHWTWSGRVCASDPFKKPWTIEADYVVTGPDPSSDHGTTELSLPQRGAVGHIGSSSWSLTGGDVGPLLMTASYDITPPVTGSAEVRNDPDCPAPGS